MSAQDRYLEALIELEELRIAAEEELRRAERLAYGRAQYNMGERKGRRDTLNDTSAGFKMALIAGMHSAIVRHFLHDDGGDAMRRVIHELNRVIREHLERVEVSGYRRSPERPDDLCVKIEWPKMQFGFNISAPYGHLPDKAEEQVMRLTTYAVNEYTSPPIPPRRTEREEYEDRMRRRKEARLADAV